jgi:tRNA 2-selenouridine synthase
MVHQLSINDFFNDQKDFTVIDVRSEIEFSVGHIKGAVNIPILTNDERRIVGTTYKQNGRQPAVFKGLDLSGPHLGERLKKGIKSIKTDKVLVHCWRGGMRSEFYSFLLHYYGLDPYMLMGGYKSYRQLVHASFDRPLSLVVLSGKTGSGKTELLQHLVDKGEQVIDLEFLAKHRGSSFGALAFEEPTTQEQFENDLFEVIRHFDPEKRIWIEDESRTIGDKVIPEGIWKQMALASRVVIEKSFDERLERIVKDYGVFNKEDLKRSMLRIGKRLGPQHVKAALEFLDVNDQHSAFAIALGYYDKAYTYQLSSFDHNKSNVIDAVGMESDLLVKRLMNYE